MGGNPRALRLSFSAVNGTLTFRATPEKSRMFWSTGYAWGTLAQIPREADTQVELTVFGGRLKLRRFVLTGGGSIEESIPREIETGEYYRVLVPKVDRGSW